MFIRFFKPNSVTPASSAASTTPVAPESKQTFSETSVDLRERRRFPRALPIPEVLEGDGGESDWVLWSDAMRKINEGYFSTDLKKPALAADRVTR